MLFDAQKCDSYKRNHCRINTEEIEMNEREKKHKNTHNQSDTCLKVLCVRLVSYEKIV